MKKFIVNIEEIHIVSVVIEADSPEEAVDRACDMIEEGVQDSTAPEYSYTLDPEHWTVVELEE
jgi:hypothetical protein